MRLSRSGPPYLAFCIGIGLTQCLAVLPDSTQAIYFVLALVFLGVLSLLFRSHRWLGYLPVILFGVFLGLAYGVVRAQWRLSDTLPLEWERQDIVIEGVIADLPRDFERGSRFVFRVEKTDTAEAKVPERILLSWSAFAEDETGSLSPARLIPGERWRFTVRLKRPHAHLNPGGFDYEAWLLERGIRATGYVRATPPAQHLGESSTPQWRERIEAVRDKVKEVLQKNLSGAAFAGVIVALAIGDQGSIPSDEWRIFAATGTSHLMSISGLHVTMLAALLGHIAAWFWRRSERLMLFMPSQRAFISFGLLAALAYTLLSGAGVPALRTLLMLLVAALTHWLNRRVGVARVLLLALLAVLLFDPWAVLAVGFWLSFAAVAVLLFFTQTEQEKTGLARLRQWTWGHWVVTLGTLPILLWVFQAVSLVSPLANALAIPLVGLLIAPLSVAAALFPLPFLATLAHALLEPLMWFLHLLAEQPWALWRQAQPAAWAVVLASVGIAWHFFSPHWRWPSLLLLLPALSPVLERPKPGEVWVDVLDVGQGLSVLVRTEKRALLYDGGPQYGASSNAGERLVVPALRALGVYYLDGIIVSHQDKDHSGGIASVQREIKSGWLASSLPENHPLRQGSSPHTRCEAGLSWQWDAVRFAFLSPPPDYYAASKMSTNRLSCVLRIEAARSSALLMGDAELTEEAILLASGQTLKANVLQVPHHGSRSSSGSEFIQAVSPDIAIFATGYRNHFGHPHPQVKERYLAQGAQILQTDASGAVSLRMGDSVEVSTQRKERPRYWVGH